MSPSARKFVVGVMLLLSAGALIGYFYEQTVAGLLVAALLCLAWQSRQLLRFERASRENDIENIGYGDGIWNQIFSRFRFERERGRRRKAAYQSLLREVRKSTDAMPDGAVILDANNEVITCNRAVKSLAGLKRRKDRGQRIDNILRDPQLTKLVNENEFGRSIEIPSPVTDGDWLNCRLAPYGADQKLLLIRDITDRIRLGKMRRDFVANASHELRSPLTVISGYLEAMSEDDSLAENWIRPVEQMRGQSSRMNQILGELMELSRIESAGSAPRDTGVDVAAVLREIRDSLASSADAATVSIDNPSAVKLLGSRAEIESIVANLLSNALRFTGTGSKIVLSWRSNERGACLAIEDDGEGIEAHHIPRLTERFYRVDQGRSRDDGGVGLGLAIVKHAVARHDGQLEITSTPGLGSTFACQFPTDRIQQDSTASVS